MPQINVLPKNIAEKIAAGEVVERPASVIKEILENAIDAGATDICVEIRGGGILYMRVTDNGCGIEKEQVPTAFLRHATSKIVNEEDLDGIHTLGFRGEALAAISSVSKVEIITRREADDLGTRYVIEGGEEKAFEEVGSPEGTTIIIRDLFFNTPARMKFLKKDVSEANIITDLIEKIALSHPEIAIRYVKDSKEIINTSGDGKLSSAVYSVLGREFFSTLIELKEELNGVCVEGFICKPIYCRPKRTSQYFFINGRLVRNGTMISALEAAYKNSVMVGKFPACVLNVTVNPSMVDVNVHPAKTEVRFSDDKAIFDGVYFAVKNALNKKDERPQINVKPSNHKAFDRMTVDEYKQIAIKEEKKNNEKYRVDYPVRIEPPVSDIVFENKKSNYTEPEIKEALKAETVSSQAPFVAVDKAVEEVKKEPEAEERAEEILEDIKFVGEAFSTYIIVEKGDSVFFIDKHASHERIIFEKLKKTETPQCQQLLLPVTVKLSAEGYNAVIEAEDLLVKGGFEVDDFGNNTIIVRGVPASLFEEDVAGLMYEVAENLTKGGNLQIERLDDIYHTVACKAAIKAGYKTSGEELIRLAKEVLSREDIFYCPHGRPVAFEIKKRELEKQFGRIQ